MKSFKAGVKKITPVNQTSATDWQMAVQQDNVIRITVRQV